METVTEEEEELIKIWEEEQLRQHQESLIDGRCPICGTYQQEKRSGYGWVYTCECGNLYLEL